MHPFFIQANKKASPQQAPSSQAPVKRSPLVQTRIPRAKKGLTFRPGQGITLLRPNFFDPFLHGLRRPVHPGSFDGGSNPQNPSRQAPATSVSRLRRQASTAAVTHVTAQTPKRELSASTLKMRQALLRHVAQMLAEGGVSHG